MPIKRDTVEPKSGDKRYVRRDEHGRFTSNQAAVGSSLAADTRQRAKKIVPAGQGDKGDQKKRS